jgi:Derlin-2/3
MPGRHAPAMILALVYLSCANAAPGARTSIFGLFTVPTRYYPYVVIGLDLIQGGPPAAACALAGALVGHTWWCALSSHRASGR